MTKQQTVMIMAMLSAYYGRPKTDPDEMANAWHLILGEYDFEVMKYAVVQYAKQDVRDYSTFPAPGVIVKIARAELARRQKPVKEILRGVNSGSGYWKLSEEAKALISEETYNEWIDVEPEKFIANQADYVSQLVNRKLIEG